MRHRHPVSAVDVDRDGGIAVPAGMHQLMRFVAALSFVAVTIGATGAAAQDTPPMANVEPTSMRQLPDVGLYLEFGGGRTHVDGDGDPGLDFGYPMGRFGLYAPQVLSSDGHNFFDIDMSLLVGAPFILLDAETRDSWDRTFYPPAGQTSERVYGASRIMAFRGVFTITPIAGPVELGVTFTPLDWGVVNVWRAIDGAIIDNGTIHGSPFAAAGIGPMIGIFPADRLDVYVSVAPHAMLWVSHDYLAGGALVGDVDVIARLIPDVLDAKLRATAEYRFFRHSESEAGHTAAFTTATLNVGIVFKFARLTGMLQ